MGGNAGSLRFTRAMRLKDGRDFARMKERGARAVQGCLVANWEFCQAGERSKLGLIVSRKVGPAVVRNRARRLLRESYRLNQHRLAKAVNLVLVARPSIAGKALAEVQRDFLTSLGKAGLLRAGYKV